jgi:RNA polymerase sigma-70 factor (ECF subfamily)
METSVQAQKDAGFIAILQNPKSTEREKQKAFEALYSKHQKQVGIYFLKQMHNKDADTAEDLKMVTFEKVHKKIGEYNADKAVFTTWMYSIARNTLIDHKRKDRFEVLSLDALAGKTSEENDGMEFQIQSDAISPEQDMIREQNIKAVREAIDSIDNENIRRIMTYRFIEELSFEEIAEREGVDKDNSTLRVNSKRGREILREKLANA